MTARRLSGPLLAAVLASAFLVALLFVGRWERDRNVRIQNKRMGEIYATATVDGLVSPLLDAYRLASAFDCLLYHRSGHPREQADYELCFDGAGRLIEAIDRHTGVVRIGSLREAPGSAAIRVPVARLMAVFGAPAVVRADPRLAGVSRDTSVLPLGDSDTGVRAVPVSARGGGS